MKKPRKKQSKAKAKRPASPAKAGKSAITDAHVSNVPTPTARTTSAASPEPPSATLKPWHHRARQAIVGIFRRKK
jgi:hypothetical protein